MNASPATSPADVRIPRASMLFQVRLVATFFQWLLQSQAPTPQGARGVNGLAFLRSKPLIFSSIQRLPVIVLSPLFSDGPSYLLLHLPASPDGWQGLPIEHAYLQARWLFQYCLQGHLVLKNILISVRTEKTSILVIFLHFKNFVFFLKVCYIYRRSEE